MSFGELTAHISLNVATNGSRTCRKTSKISYYSKEKKDECNQSNLADFLRFIPRTTTHFLEVCGRVSPKVTTNCSFRGK